MQRRILSLLLALALLCAMLPQITWPAHADPATSGTCGDNLTWRFDASTGTLTIEGSGEMDNYGLHAPPWHAHMYSIKQIVFPAGLTSIGGDAFSSCTGLTSVTFPAGLTSIGECAFYYCTGLTSVTFPDGLTEIGRSAFYGCTGLTQITLPAGLTYIGYEAFRGCTGLTQITLPAGLTEISDGAFYGCTGLTAFSVASANPNFSSKAGVVFNKKGTELILYPCGRTGAYTVPAGVTSIGDDAFYGCTGLTQITLPAGLTEIGENAFMGCTGLTQLTLPAGLTEIGWHAFKGCTGLTAFSVASANPNFSSKAGVVFNKKGTELILYPCGRTGAYTVPAGVTSIGGGAFSGCTGLTQLTLPDGLTKIGEDAFEGCTGLTQLKFPAGLTEIGDGAFSSCTGLTQLTLPAGLTEIGIFAFYGCTGLTQLKFPAGLTKIDYAAFSGCTGLTQLTLPAGLTKIDYAAFFGCTGLTQLTLPAGLTEIDQGAFHGCTGLTQLTLPDGLTYIGEEAFRGCTGLTQITFPDALTEIGWHAFYGCTGLTDVVIPASVTEIGGLAFGYRWDADDFNHKPIASFKIYGYKGTAAQAYAQENGFRFIPLDPQSGFADVKPKHYYYNAMLWALERGITSGTSRVTFSPNDTCTRGQVMTFLYAAKGKPEADWSNNPFVDVKKSKYYFKPVLWAFQNGITNGVDDTHFQPNGSCTRAQVVTFLWALSGKPNPKAGSNPFKDVKKSNWYYKAVLWAYQNGITSGVDPTHFGPNQTCTRGQVVTFLYALLGK